MFTIENNNNLLLLKSNTSKAIINLKEGARVQDLTFNDVAIIKEIPLFDYKNSYASSILFPFANRIKEGKYRFENKEYTFNCNEGGGKNALHGLVFDKEFLFIEKEITTTKCAVTLCYKEQKKPKSFPFNYEFYVTYILSEDNFTVSVEVKNTDTNAFPFTLGWHPYFYCENLKDSVLNFDSNKKVEFDENLITNGFSDYDEGSIFKIENKQLDDSFVLQNGKIGFTTPKYSLEISASSKENYLQMYTPKDLPLIAIEPMTGISNSFNNKIGLQVLEPQKSYSLNWNLNVKTL